MAHSRPNGVMLIGSPEALTQSSRNVSDAFLISHVVEAKDTVNCRQGFAVHVCWPFDPSFATKVDIVE